MFKVEGVKVGMNLDGKHIFFLEKAIYMTLYIVYRHIYIIIIYIPIYRYLYIYIYIFGWVMFSLLGGKIMGLVRWEEQESWTCSSSFFFFASVCTCVNCDVRMCSGDDGFFSLA